MNPDIALGIDIGGSAIKGAPVDLSQGCLIDDRKKIPTPEKSKPKNCADVVAKIVKHFHDDIGDDTPIGISVPAPVRNGVVPMIANLHKSWVGADVISIFSERLERPVYIMNDADAAGIAEARFGAAHGVDGVVIVTTLGTGIGSAMLLNGTLIPNTELGHIEIDGHDAESRASSAVKSREKMSYKRWARRLQLYYSTLERLLWPDLFIVGGGVSKDHEKFLPLLDLRTPIVPAHLRNQAGIVGAAISAADALKKQ